MIQKHIVILTKRNVCFCTGYVMIYTGYVMIYTGQKNFAS